MPVVATRSDLDALLPGVSDAVDAVDDGLIDERLETAADTVGGVDFWSGQLARMQAYGTLHLLSREGILARANVEDPGESGPVASRAGLSFATAAGEADLGLSLWGRTLLGARRAKLAVTMPFVSHTGY